MYRFSSLRQQGSLCKPDCLFFAMLFQAKRDWEGGTLFPESLLNIVVTISESHSPHLETVGVCR